jgi:hypothetical protein
MSNNKQSSVVYIIERVVISSTQYDEQLKNRRTSQSNAQK